MQDKHKTWVFRMIHHLNLEHILKHGIYCRGAGLDNPDYVPIGSSEIVSRRDRVIVKCFPDTQVNNYVPFYFGSRTPMLYKIRTGNEVSQIPQNEIIYLCCRLIELTESGLQWCFTDWNAAVSITKFFTDVDDLDGLDWKSIHSIDWSDHNADGDHDRLRKKHSEFLVKGQVPIHFIKQIIVQTEERKKLVDDLLRKHGLDVKVYKDAKFYF